MVFWFFFFFHSFFACRCVWRRNWRASIAREAKSALHRRRVIQYSARLLTKTYAHACTLLTAVTSPAIVIHHRRTTRYLINIPWMRLVEQIHTQAHAGTRTHTHALTGRRALPLGLAGCWKSVCVSVGKWVEVCRSSAESRRKHLVFVEAWRVLAANYSPGSSLQCHGCSPPIHTYTH